MGRRLLMIVATAALIAGCGSSSSSPATSPVSTELSYFPTDTPFVMTIATDPNVGSVQQAQGLIGRFQAASFGIAAFEAELSRVGLSYQNDVHPLFGNPIALGIGGTAISRNAFLGVWVTKDSSALHRIAAKLGASSGTHDGATLYSIGALGAALAIDGSTVVVGSAASVTAALDRHAHGGGFTAAELQSDTTGLPQNTVMEAVGDMTGVLSQPGAATARTIPWVGAVRSYGAAITASSSGVDLQFRVDTSGATLSASQLPIAPGTTAPGLPGTMPIVVAIHDAAQTVAFIKQADPGAFAKLAPARQAEVAKLIGLLSGDAIVGSDGHAIILRATVSDPATAAHVLATATDVKPAGGGFYTRGGRLLGVVGNQFVSATHTTITQARAFATAPVMPATFAHGSVAFRIHLLDLLHMTLKQAPPAILQALLNQLGDITGWAASSTGALTGGATLAIK